MLKDDDDDDAEDVVVAVGVLTIDGCGEDPPTNARRRVVTDWEVTKARVTRQCTSSTVEVAIANAAFMRNCFCFWVVGGVCVGWVLLILRNL
jgi:hypothetical protein